MVSLWTRIEDATDPNLRVKIFMTPGDPGMFTQMGSDCVLPTTEEKKDLEMYGYFTRYII